MTDAGGLLTMARPRKKTPGRPKADAPLRSLVSLKGTDEFEAWLDGLVDHARQGTRSLLLRNALHEFAEKHGYQVPQPKR